MTGPGQRSANLNLDTYLTPGFPVADWFRNHRLGDTVKSKDGQTGRFVEFVAYGDRIGMDVEIGIGQRSRTTWMNLDNVEIPRTVRRMSMRSIAHVAHRW